MTEKFYIVTGAPGSGKTVVAHELVKRQLSLLVYDTDWLLASASELSGKNIVFDSSTWPAYRKLWLEVLRMAQINNKQAVLFAAIDKDDVAQLGQEIADQIEWCLLDCMDDERTERLKQRPDWSDVMAREAIVDAKKLRNQITHVINTDSQSVAETASILQGWLAVK